MVDSNAMKKTFVVPDIKPLDQYDSSRARICASVGWLLARSYGNAVSDLAPGESGVDDMRMLEQKAHQLAVEAEQDKPKPKDKILFVRSDTSRSELAQLAKQANPDEIDIDEDEDAEDGEPDEVQLEQKTVPTAVFGGLKDD
ncbi:pre-mRNA-splicing factor SYF1 [Pimephales promelas]|nr:pre-mRNA-splicing factor SYF1 [Pimephales promelas]